MTWSPPFPWVVSKFGIGNQDETPEFVESWNVSGRNFRDHLRQFLYFIDEETAMLHWSWLVVCSPLITKLR